MELYSSAFDNNEQLPAKYTCDGENVSPPLGWDNVPEETKTFALIMDDPDAPGGDFVHWLVYNIPASMTDLDENITNLNLVDSMAMGTNDFRRIGYGGPCPPSGNAHHYFIRLYALDTIMKLDAGASKKELLNAMEGSIVLKTEISCKYSRTKK